MSKKIAQKIEGRDLHGSTKIEAENLMYNFLAKARENNYKKVKIITGYGLNSPQGNSILKELMKKILEEKGLKYLYLEGRGIFEIYIDSASNAK